MNKTIKVVGIFSIIIGIMNIGKYLHYASYDNVHYYFSLIIGVWCIWFGINLLKS